MLTFATATQLATPATPSASAVSNSLTSITVTYTTVSNATSYTVQVFDGSNTKVGSDHTSFTSGSTITGLSANTTYSVKVIAIGDGTIYSNSAASSPASVTTNAAAVAPTISSQPSSATKYAGQSITFSVTASASDSGSLSYQWQKDASNISGATNSSYSIASVASGDAGSYTVIVTNTKNGTTATTTSNAGVLTVNNPLATDSTLSNLVVNGASIGSFSSGTTSYSATVANSTSSLTLTPTANESHATIKVNGSSVNSGSTSSNISLTVGNNTISLVVSAQDSSTTTYTLTITRSAQPGNVISFGSIASKYYGDSFSITVSASSGLSVSVAPSDTAICSVTSYTVIALGVGTCTLTASQAGDSTYPAATQVVQSFIINKKTLTITVANVSSAIGATPSSPNYSQSGLVTSLGDSIATFGFKYSGIGGTYYPISSTAPTSLGTYRIASEGVALSSGSLANYTLVTVDGTLTVSGNSTNVVNAISLKPTATGRNDELLTSFSNAVTSYTIYVGADVSAVIGSITRPTGSQISFQVKINDSGYRKLTFSNNVASSGALALPLAINTVVFTSRASDLSSRDFTITVYRDTKTIPTGGSTAAPAPSASAAPAAQVVSAVRFLVNNIGGQSEVSVSPAFSRTTYSYTASFSAIQSAAQMKVDFSGAGVTLRLKVNSGPFIVIPSVGTSSIFSISKGSNSAILRVMSSDGTSTDYNFTLSRAN